MGYCNRCGDIINNSKCRKCGGKPVESIAKGAVDSKSSIVDRWQNQYANSILSGPHPAGTTSTPIGKRSSVVNFTSSYRAQSPPVSVQPKTCILCHKAVPLGTQLGKNDYCHDCRAKISDNKPTNRTVKPMESTQAECATCSQPVGLDQPKVQRKGRTWHKDCIRCNVCSNPLSNPTALDLDGSSRCVPCQTANKRIGPLQPLPTSPTSTINSSIGSASRFSPIPRSIRNDIYGSTTSDSTYDGDSTVSSRRKSLTGISSNARPRLDSQLFQQYQKSVNQQLQQPSSPPSTSINNISSIRPLASQSSSPSLSSYMDKPRMKMSSSTTTTTTVPPKQQLKQRRSSLTPDKPSSSSKKTCRKCMQVLRGPRVRLPTPNGDTWYYHYDCLTCAACGDHFTESEFVGDGKDVFHLHCRAPSPATSSTPPPLSPTTSSSPDPISPSTSPIPAASQSSTTQPHLRSRRLSSTPPQPLDYRCHTCNLPIQDKCLKNGTRFFHPNCFTCYSCHEHLPSDRPFYDIQQEAHCEICTKLIIKTGSGAVANTSGGSVADRRKSMPGDNFYRPTPIHTSSTGASTSSISSPLSPSTSSPLVARSGDNGESRIWMNRTRALPKLGGSKICPGCNKSIAVMDDAPGPKASRWHKKCLKCTGCKKQMDSDAKVIELNEKSMVRCSDCSDKKSKPHYVR
ncbi:unnamed protein product [Absidia cylindrospora]